MEKDKEDVEEKKKRRKVESESESESESDDSSDSSSDVKRKKHKKKKTKKDKKVKKTKKDKKSKKLKKERSKKADKGTGVASLYQEWGKHGVIRESDIHSKSNEFYAWCMEVKRISRESLGRKEEKDLFSQFVEDYNTGTLPSEKYYDLGKWAANPLNRKEASNLDGLSDEDRLRVLRQEEREARNKAADSSRVMAIKQQLMQAKAEKGEVFAEVTKRYQQSLLVRPTFESIAKAREAKKEAELDARKGYY